MKPTAYLSFFCFFLILQSCSNKKAPLTPLQLEKGDTIVLIGNTLGERMQYFGHLETALYQNFPNHDLTVRNLCWPADTPDLRPRCQGRDPGKALKDQNPDVVFAFFGYNESFEGKEGLEKFGKNLDHFLKDSVLNKLSIEPSKVVLFTPIAFEDLSDRQLLPDGKTENEKLDLYALKIKEVAERNGVFFVDLFGPTYELFNSNEIPLTINGCHLNDEGYKALAKIIHQRLFGKYDENPETYELLRSMVNEKSYQFLMEFRPVNGVHTYGERVKPFGVVSYPPEFAKLHKMVANRDQRIWEIASGKSTSLEIDDSNTGELPQIETNYDQPFTYLSTKEAIKTFTLPNGYEINLFASEEDFPELANPVQMSFDDRGRLWVAVMPTYPQYLPGTPVNDKLLIYEDTNNDGKADRQTVFADGLHLPNGFEFGDGGVYVAQAPNLWFLKDTDGDDIADQKDILLHGFSSHDSHHSIGAFTTDASGAIYMAEGIFLHTQVETPYGPVRGKDGVIYRWDPKTWRLDAIVRYAFANPWGIGFDDYGDSFIADASGGSNYAMANIMCKLPYGEMHRKMVSLTANNMVRPTAGFEIVSSRHFPEDIQGDFLINNCIGLLGTRQHQLVPNGAGFRTELRQDLLSSSDPNFRPVDLEFAPDGSLYIVDWHNALVGHMQHSVRDPNRDHTHGRIWRITNKKRPLLKPVKIEGASIDELFQLLEKDEYRTRYRARRALRSQPQKQVLLSLKEWTSGLSAADENHDRNLLEALNVSWGQHAIDKELLEANLKSKNYRSRLAAVRIIRHHWYEIPGYFEYLQQAAKDESFKVRLEALLAAGELTTKESIEIAAIIAKQDRDYFLDYTLNYHMLAFREKAQQALDNKEPWAISEKEVINMLINLPDPNEPGQNESFASANVDYKIWKLGSEVYRRDAHCVTCHQPDGNGLENTYPPLRKSEWVTGDPERLIKITLHGMYGDIEVNGKRYPGSKTPPMTAFKALLSDDELAAALSYIRNNWGNSASAIDPAMVKKVREESSARKAFWTEKELLEAHPWPKNVSHQKPLTHLGLGASVVTEPAPSNNYNTKLRSLTDGSRGPLDHNDPNWLGFQGGDVEVIIDLKTKKKIQEIQVNCLTEHGAWVLFPKQIDYSISSDSINYEKVGTLHREENKDSKTQDIHAFPLKTNKEARFVKIKLYSNSPIPDWHLAAGNKAWIFIDEVIVN